MRGAPSTTAATLSKTMTAFTVKGLAVILTLLMVTVTFAQATAFVGGLIVLIAALMREISIPRWRSKMKLEVGKTYQSREAMIQILAEMDPFGETRRFVGKIFYKKDNDDYGLGVWAFNGESLKLGNSASGSSSFDILSEITPKRKLLAWRRTDDTHVDILEGGIVLKEEHEIIAGNWERVPGLDQEL